MSIYSFVAFRPNYFDECNIPFHNIHALRTSNRFELGLEFGNTSGAFTMAASIGKGFRCPPLRGLIICIGTRFNKKLGNFTAAPSCRAEQWGESLLIYNVHIRAVLNQHSYNF